MYINPFSSWCNPLVSSPRNREKMSREDILKQFTKVPKDTPFVAYCFYDDHNDGWGHSALSIYRANKSLDKPVLSVNYVQHRGINTNPFSYRKALWPKFAYFIPIEDEKIAECKRWYTNSFENRHDYSLLFKNCATAASQSLEKLGIDLNYNPFIDRPWYLHGCVEDYLIENHEDLSFH